MEDEPCLGKQDDDEVDQDGPKGYSADHPDPGLVHR